MPPKAIKRVLFEDTSGTVEMLDVFIQETIVSVKQEIESAVSLHDRIIAIYENIDMFKVILKNVAPKVFPGLISMKKLETLEKKLLGTNKYAREVLKGLEGNVTTEMGLFAGDLADYVRKSDALRQAFENKDFSSFFARIAKLDDETDYVNAVDSGQHHA